MTPHTLWSGPHVRVGIPSTAVKQRNGSQVGRDVFIG
jgi:tetrahydromethanopterin S-methyltransferase subunit G